MTRWLTLFTNLFPVWVVAGGILALIHPPLFTWFKGPLIVWGLAVIMLGMGITLSLEDFKRVLLMPKSVAAGLMAQFCIMPFLGWAIGRVLGLPTPFAVGLILVSCCPGGTASNVVAYIARAHVALSVLLTMCSTFAAILLTPLLTKFLAGTLVPVDAWKLFLDTVQVVLLPVLCGIGLNHFFPKTVKAVLPISPLVSVVTIALICASIIGSSAPAIRQSAGILLTAVFLLHSFGFGLGYLFARLLNYEEIICRTVSIEVGMQNSGLGTVLARNNFSDPLTAVPCALSATFHSVIGSFLAAVWRLRPPRSN
ncbi:MAG: bile acid:sodium symporter family protein [Verrucomicrobia bacterium]|nr:bile acid:sodium symporter family protein [Verrucomicrobiota bacterium]